MKMDSLNSRKHKSDEQQMSNGCMKRVTGRCNTIRIWDRNMKCTIWIQRIRINYVKVSNNEMVQHLMLKNGNEVMNIDTANDKCWKRKQML